MTTNTNIKEYLMIIQWLSKTTSSKEQFELDLSRTLFDLNHK